MNNPSSTDRTGRQARTVLPARVHAHLAHLAIELGTTLSALLVEGAILVCRYHGRGDALPGPMAPLQTTNEGDTK